MKPCKKALKSGSLSSLNQPRIRRNSLESPFLRAPYDVREKILRLVVGDHLIHLSSHDPYPGGPCKLDKRHIRHSICVCPFTEDDAYQKFSNGGEEDFAYAGHHMGCLLNESQTTTAQCRIDLQILGASRQSYEEALNLFWNTNMFSFPIDDYRTFSAFVSRLNAQQRGKIAKVQISASSYEDLEQDELSRHVSPEALRQLKGLRTLHIHFLQRPRLFEWINSDPERPDPCRLLYLPPFAAFQGINWKHVTVVVGDDIEAKHSIPPSRWSSHKKRQFAKDLRQRLLNPTEGGVFCTEAIACEDE